jgi:hypothetical protein
MLRDRNNSTDKSIQINNRGSGKINEGSEKKGGVNPQSNGPKPNFTPPAQKPSQSTNTGGTGGNQGSSKD